MNSSSRKAAYASRLVSAAVYSATFSSAIPPFQSSPSPSCGPTPAIEAAARHRSGRRAAQPSARGPPPDQPAVTNRSTPSASRITTESATSSTIRGSGRGRAVESPYPGRE